MQCSEIFKNVFDSGCGGCLRTCDCGITYFDGYHNGWSWEEGELEDLRQKAIDNPEKYIEVDCTPGTMEIDGREIVFGCTCETAARYESFIDNHSHQLAKYLNMKADELREEANLIEVKQPQYRRLPTLTAVRNYRARCSKCMDKDYDKYLIGQCGRTWENVGWKRSTSDGNYLFCKNCGHEWYSQSMAGWKLQRICAKGIIPITAYNTVIGITKPRHE